MQNILQKGFPNWPENVFVIKQVRNTVQRTYVICDFNGEETVGSFYENKLQKKEKKIKQILELRK